jgi:hypothetical protein
MVRRVDEFMEDNKLHYVCLKIGRLIKKSPPPPNLQFVFLPCPFDHRMRHLSLCVDGDSLQRRPAQLFGWARMGPKERTGPTWTGTCIWCLPVMRWVFSLSRGDESEIKHENAPSHLCVYFTSFSTNIYIYIYPRPITISKSLDAPLIAKENK